MLSGKYLQLTANWEFADKSYAEQAIIGVNPEKEVCFWSFTSDGKQSNGKLVDATDVHSEAIGFEAQMPAGTARMVYFPDEDKGFYWIVNRRPKRAGTDLLNITIYQSTSQRVRSEYKKICKA